MDTAGPEKGCLLCGEIWSVDALSDRLSRYRSREDKVLVESERFLSIPDISPLAPGHHLIISRRHVPSLADMPDDCYDELEEIHRRTLARLGAGNEVNGGADAILFEHGGFAGQRMSGSCVNHAHLHVVPLPRRALRVPPPPLREWLAEHGDVMPVDRFQDVASAARAHGRGYLFGEELDGQRWVVPELLTPVPCQYLRRMLGEHLHLPHWNWKAVLLNGDRAPEEAVAT